MAASPDMYQKQATMEGGAYESDGGRIQFQFGLTSEGETQRTESLNLAVEGSCCREITRG
jgi:hypothetical protein